MVLVDKNDRTPHDMTRVGLDEEWEVRYWCAHFAVDQDTLRACVTEVGPRVEDVQEKLSKIPRQVFRNTGED
jgi:hypothetical protein